MKKNVNVFLFGEVISYAVENGLVEKWSLRPSKPKTIQGYRLVTLTNNPSSEFSDRYDQLVRDDNASVSGLVFSVPKSMLEHVDVLHDYYADGTWSSINTRVKVDDVFVYIAA